MLCFMVKHLHTKKRTDGTAQESDHQQAIFRRSPPMPFCPALVAPIRKKRQQACYRIPNQQISDHKEFLSVKVFEEMGVWGKRDFFLKKVPLPPRSYPFFTISNASAAISTVSLMSSSVSDALIKWL